MNKKNHQFFGFLIAIIFVSVFSFCFLSTNLQDEYFSGFLLRFQIKQEEGENLKKVFVSHQSIVPNSTKSISTCQSNGLMTVYNGGQLGNKMFEYAALFAHSKRLGVPAVIEEEMRETISKSFPNISIPSFSPTCSMNWTAWDYSIINQLSLDELGDKNIMLYQWTFSVEEFNFYHHQLISEEFVFQQDMKNEAHNFLRDIVKNSSISKDFIFVSVHVRRSDFKEWMITYAKGGFVASHKFYKSAMENYRNKYNSETSTIVFVMASDDDQWCRKMFGKMSDVIYTSSATTNLSKQQPTFDLAVLSNCNHSIIGLGTFGFWTAYLKEKGDVIFVTGTSAYPTYTEPSIREHLQNWKLLEDPCYEKNSEGDMSLKEDCAGLD